MAKFEKFAERRRKKAAGVGQIGEVTSAGSVVVGYVVVFVLNLTKTKLHSFAFVSCGRVRRKATFWFLGQRFPVGDV